VSRRTRCPKEFVFDAEGGMVDPELLFFAPAGAAAEGEGGPRQERHLLRRPRALHQAHVPQGTSPHPMCLGVHPHVPKAPPLSPCAPRSPRTHAPKGYPPPLSFWASEVPSSGPVRPMGILLPGSGRLGVGVGVVRGAGPCAAAGGRRHSARSGPCQRLRRERAATAWGRG